MQRLLEVRSEDIVFGGQGQPMDCAIHRAFARQLGLTAKVDGMFYTFLSADGQSVGQFTLGPECKRFITAFDHPTVGTADRIHPFRTVVQIPLALAPTVLKHEESQRGREAQSVNEWFGTDFTADDVAQSEGAADYVSEAELVTVA